jgi:putative endonuclease
MARASDPPSRPADARRELGRRGEEQAAAWYARAGYAVVARNWRTRYGELDLVCRAPGVIVFCEVKTRRTARLGAPVEAVTPAKQRRLRRLAAVYLIAHPAPGTQVRFDVAAVLGCSLSVVTGAF